VDYASFLSLEDSNRMVRKSLNVKHAMKNEDYIRYMGRFSINCICYAYKHWTEIGGMPKEDELGWGRWIEE